MNLLAHGLGDAGDLPVPLPTVLYLAALCIVVAAALSGRRTVPDGSRTLPSWLTAAADHPTLRGALQALGLAGFGALVVTAALGPASAANNPAPRLAYVLAWTALTLLPLLLGDVWPLLNPWRTLAIGVAHLVGDPEERTAEEVPAHWGVWPAVPQLALVVYVQVLHQHSARVLLLVLAGLTLVQLLGAIRYGRAWFSHADPFEVYAGLIARASPLGRDGDGRLVLRNPAGAPGLAALAARRGAVWIVALGIGASLLDFVIDTPVFHELRGSLDQGARVAADTATLLLIVLAVGLLVGLAVRRVPVLLGAFVPVVVGYAVAHDVGVLPVEGQFALIQLSDPFDRGWDLIGQADRFVPLEPVPPMAVAISVVVVLIATHVWAVLLGQRLLGRGRDARTAAALQLPLRAILAVSVVGGIAARLIVS